MNKSIGSILAGTSIMVLTLSSCDPDMLNTGPNGTNLKERIIKDTAYGSDAKQKMDIYLPEKRTSATPVVVMIHGGGWSGGDKADMNSTVALIRNKWPETAIVNINYRLANGNTITANQQMDDVQAAVQFIANNKDAFKVSNAMGMVGASAGAQLALLYTYSYNDKNYVRAVSDLFGPCIIDDWTWYNTYNVFLGTSIKSILTNYNGTTWEDNDIPYHTNSPYRQATTGEKPTIIFHGSLDVVVPLYHSQWLHAKLDSLQVPNEYHEYVDGHGFNATNADDCANKTVVFFKKYVK